MNKVQTSHSRKGPNTVVRRRTRSGIDVKRLDVCRSCGAVTLLTMSEHAYSMPRSIADKILPTKSLIFDNKWVHCDHCVNKWGVDICACGSGELFWECEEAHHNCGKPRQILPGLTPEDVRKMLEKPKQIEEIPHVIEASICST